MSDYMSEATKNLIAACRERDYNAAKEAIEQGADVNFTFEKGMSILSFVASVTSYNEKTNSKECKIMQLLIDNGANVNGSGSKKDCPLACVLARKSFVDYDPIPYWNKTYLLLKNGANPRRIKLPCITRMHDISILKLFLDYGADVNDHLRSGGLFEDENTSLHCAGEYCGDVEKAKLLLEYGADLNIKNKDGKTPYEAAAALSWNYGVVAELIKKWEVMEHNGTRPPSKKPTFGGKVNPSIQTTANSVTPTPEQQAEELKKTYLNHSSTEIAKCLLSTDDFTKVQKIFSGNLEPLVKKMTHQEAMRVYVHIYKKLTPIEKVTYQKGVVALQKQQKAKTIKRKEYEASK